MKNPIIYNIDIAVLVDRLKEIYMSGCNRVNLTFENDKTLKLNGVEDEIKRLPPSQSDDVLKYLN